jgi:hypothetical protein
VISPKDIPADELIYLPLALSKNRLSRPSHIEHVGLIQEALPLSGVHHEQFVLAREVFVW